MEAETTTFKALGKLFIFCKFNDFYSFNYELFESRGKNTRPKKGNAFSSNSLTLEVSANKLFFLYIYNKESAIYDFINTEDFQLAKNEKSKPKLPLKTSWTETPISKNKCKDFPNVSHTTHRNSPIYTKFESDSESETEPERIYEEGEDEEKYCEFIKDDSSIVTLNDTMDECELISTNPPSDEPGSESIHSESEYSETSAVSYIESDSEDEDEIYRSQSESQDKSEEAKDNLLDPPSGNPPSNAAPPPIDFLDSSSWRQKKPNKTSTNTPKEKKSKKKSWFS